MQRTIVSGFFSTLTALLLSAVASAQSPQVGKSFVPPPPLPAAPYGLQDLDTSGPLFPGQPFQAEQFDNAMPPVVIDGQVVGEAPDTSYALSDFLTLASQNNPTLRQARLQISAQTAKALQAGLYPNPVLAYSGEQIGVDVPGDKDSPGEFQGLLLEQRFVTAGKLKLSREKYMRRAHISQHLAMVQQFRVCNDVRIHFYEALAASEIVMLKQELLKSAEDVAVTSRELYNMGQATRPETRRASIALQRARLDVLQSENEYRGAFRALISIVGVDLSLGRLDGQLAPESDPIRYEEARSLVLSESPELAAARAKLSADRVTVRREQVEWVPDIVARGGAGYNFDANESVAAAELSIELPVYDRNQGTIRQAQLDLRRQQEEIRRTELDLQQRLAGAYQRYITALQMATEYDRVIIPEAKLAYQEYLESYKANRVDWPQVLETQHDFFDARLARVRHLREARHHEVLVRGFLLHDGLMAAPGPTPPGHIDAVPKPR